jgi:hypothetical protein
MTASVVADESSAAVPFVTRAYVSLLIAGFALVPAYLIASRVPP